MNACTYEKLCEHEILYESYTYSEQPEIAKPTNIEKYKMLRNQPLSNDVFFFTYTYARTKPHDVTSGKIKKLKKLKKKDRITHQVRKC